MTTATDSHGPEETHGLRRIVVIVLLLAGMQALYHFEQFGAHPFDPTGMLALGFIVLASYTVGALVGQIRLPHITGYLLAGLIFGPSMAQALGFLKLPAPFDDGILNREVISQLSLMDTLAVALIALTAGGELKIEILKKGLRAIGSILGTQFLFVMGSCMLFFAIVSGWLPALTLPGLEGVPMAAALAIGAMVGSIAFATSPAATIAVILETKASGPMTQNVLSTVVLKDVVVVVAFAVSQVLLAQQLGTANAVELAPYLLQHIVLPIILGAIVVGGAMALYVRFVNQELLVFVVGVVYLVAYICEVLGWEPILVFLAAGFGVSNFTKTGHRLIEAVERLSLPVYVVFFTLAGAKLHLDELQQLAVFAIAFVSLRAAAMLFGTRLGARIGAADDATRRYGWMGFVSQAGVSISLAALVGSRFGDLGRSLETLIIGGVAINELVGPVLLKVGLSLSGETRQSQEALEPAAHMAVKPPSILPPRDGEGKAKLEPWPALVGPKDLWGPALKTASPELNSHMQSLGIELQSIVRSVSTGPLREFQVEAEKYLRDLRREFLRHHRRLIAQARSTGEEHRDALGTMFRVAQADLAAHWRGIVLGRSVTVSKQTWTPERAVEAVDAVVDELPVSLMAPIEAQTYEPREEDDLVKQARRGLLRAARSWRATFGQSPPQRDVHVQALGRYHLSYDAPARLEALAALFVEADRHLTARTSSIFEGISAGYDDIAQVAAQSGMDLEELLSNLRGEVEEELALALEEVQRITLDGTNRAANALASGYVGMKEDLPSFGTLDLPTSERRTSRKFADRMRAMETLTKDLANLRKASAAEYSMLAMDLELLGLEAKDKEIIEEYLARATNTVHRRAVAQADRVSEALAATLQRLEHDLAQDYSGAELGAALKESTENAAKVTEEAARVVSELYDDLSDDAKIAPLLDALVDSCRGLTPRYRISVGRHLHGEWHLPTPLPEVDVPFREVVLTYMDSRAAPQLLKSRRELASKVLPLANLLKELERLVAFNVELATTELEYVHEEAVPEEMSSLLRDMVAGQLDRSYAQLEEIRTEAQQWAPDHAEEVREATIGTLELLRAQLSEGSFSRARLEAMRRAASGLRMIDSIERMPGGLEDWVAQFEAGLKAIFGEDRIDRWVERLGLFPSTPTEELTADSFAAPRLSADLPLVYKRLFAADTMEAGDVLTGRGEEIRRAESVLASEVRGRLRSVAIVGIDGVGKASIVSAIVRSRRWKNVRRVSFTEPVGVEEVEAIFHDPPEGQLIVVDGLRWMLSMGPDGFEPLRRFVAGIIAEGGRRRWLTHADVLFWNFAGTVAPLRDAFPEVIRIEPLNAEALQAAVIARHRLSGYEHSFDRGGGSAIEGMFARGASRIRRPYDQYFEELHQATGGLVRDALRLWLASIKDVQAGEIVRVGRVPASSYSRLARLPDDVLVNLYQVARQGWIDAVGQARLFRLDTNTAQAQLSRLAHLGLLQENGGAFELSLHLRGALGRIFDERGWVQ
jgi:Kef-type K+ transport system membrane component KefB